MRSRYAALLAGVLLLAAGCGGGDDDATSPEPTGSPASMPTGDPSGVPSTPPVSKAATSPTRPPLAEPRMTQLTSKQAVGALRISGYTCETDVAYWICRGSSPVEVWVLAGDQPRFPVVSLHAPGAVPTAREAIGIALPKVLRIVHINELLIIDDWYRDQTDQPTASTNIGDWRVALSAEEGTDTPGVHLTLNDKRCKKACEAE